MSVGDAVRAGYTLAFQISPIILQGGIVGGSLPIIALYASLDTLSSIVDPSEAFAQFIPMPGSTLISNSVAMYPFANQQVAANAIIQQPLTLSMRMIAPVNQPNGYQTKLATWTGLQASLQAHNNAGGTYSIATPAFIYNNVIMTGMTDVTSGEGNQHQIEYQLDFIQPLVTLSAAAAAQNTLMQKLTSGSQITGVPSYSGLTPSAYTATAGLVGAVTRFAGI